MIGNSRHMIKKSVSMSYCRQWRETQRIRLKPALPHRLSVNLIMDISSPSFMGLHIQRRCCSKHVSLSQVHIDRLRHRHTCLFRSRLSKLWMNASRNTTINCNYSSRVGEGFSNPVDRLQLFVDAPILSPENHLFNPSEKEIQTASAFWLDSMKKVKFLTSVKFHEQLPNDNLPEVTFIGQSNVGKSSLIKELIVQSDANVRISKKPGHTRLLNFFEVKGRFRLVDVPGYGFRMPEDYVDLVEQFLKNRARLCRTCLVFDSSLTLNETDMIGLDMLEEFQIPYVVVMTKMDMAAPAVVLDNFLAVQKVIKGARYCFPQPFLVSAVTGEGVPFLQTFLTYVTGHIAIKG